MYKPTGFHPDHGRAMREAHTACRWYTLISREGEHHEMFKPMTEFGLNPLYLTLIVLACFFVLYQVLKRLPGDAPVYVDQPYTYGRQMTCPDGYGDPEVMSGSTLYRCYLEDWRR